MALDNNMNDSTDRVVEQAERACNDAGMRLTPKRRNVLVTLLSSETPLSDS